MKTEVTTVSIPFILHPSRNRRRGHLPRTRETALRLGFVTHTEMTAALVRAVEHPSEEFRVLAVPDIRASASA
jgi:hypothetical protein